MGSETYRIRDVGPIRELEVAVEPGVTILEGENGAGKTNAIRAIARAAGDKGQVVEARDGARKGSVTGPGVIISVGKRVSATGEPVIELADYGSLAKLIEPGIKGEAARARSRVEALLGLVNLEVGAEEVLVLAGGDEDVAAAVQGKLKGSGCAPLPDVIGAVRKMAHALAREAETRRDEAVGAIEGLEARIEGMPAEFPAEPVADLQRAALEAAKLVDKLRADQERQAALMAQRKAIEGSLGERPDVNLARLRADDAITAAESLATELARARERSAAAEAEFAIAAGAAERWDRQSAILNAPAEQPVFDHDIRVAQEEAAGAELRVEWARMRDEHQITRRQIKGEQAKLGAAAEKAEHYRDLAAGVASATRDLLRERGLPGLEIEDDRLAYAGPETEGVVVDFDRLSLGQRTGIALRLAPPGVLPLDPGFWASLQPSGQLEVARVAVERGARILTEAPSDDPAITVRHLPEAG